MNKTEDPTATTAFAIMSKIPGIFAEHGGETAMAVMECTSKIAGAMKEFSPEVLKLSMKLIVGTCPPDVLAELQKEIFE